MLHLDVCIDLTYRGKISLSKRELGRLDGKQYIAQILFDACTTLHEYAGIKFLFLRPMGLTQSLGRDDLIHHIDHCGKLERTKIHT